MFSSDKGIIASQVLQSKKPKGKNIKPVYRELLDNEKNLLNFQFNDYHEHHGHYSDYQPPKSKPLSFSEKKLLKMSYLHGNFKFLVNPDYEENITYVDPDQEIKWKTIVKVKYSASSLITCPICLNDVYDMMFPKITRCGHIFCLSCILKYLSYKKTKCPLCDDFLMEEDLRGVEILSYQFAKPGETITLRLKKRRRLENTVYNAEGFVEDEDFIRIKKLSWEDILKNNEEEMKMMLEYMINLEYENDKDIKPFIEQGVNQLSLKIENVQKALMLARQKKGRGSEEEIVIQPQQPEKSDSPTEDEYLYFYQDISGLNLFLHPINNKYIKEQYKDVKDLPLILEASLIEIKGFEQTETTQKRYKFLNHLPRNSNINFAEVELYEILSIDNLAKLRDEMEAYKKTCKMTSVHPKKEPSPKTSVDLSSHKKQTETPGAPTEEESKSSSNTSNTSNNKYKVTFPVSPSQLKLHCTEEYPDLSSLADDKHKTTEAKGAWQLPMKKKNKSSKKTVYHVESLSERTDVDNIVTEKKIEVVLKKESNGQNEDTWRVVKPEKNIFTTLKE